MLIQQLINLSKPEPSIVHEDDGQFTMDELIDKYFDKFGYSLEGRRGLTNFCRLVGILGYKDSNYQLQLSADASVGDLINFLEDNSGAFEAMVEFIKAHRNKEWEDSLTEYFSEEGDNEDVRQESVELTEKVFDEDKYDWYVWTEKKPTKPFERRGGAKQIERGMQFGLRAATSKPGTWRLVLKQNGPSIIFSIEARDAQMLIDAALKLK